MANLLSVHLIPTHGRPEDLEYISRLRPAVVKTVDADPHRVAQIYERLGPEPLYLLRDWALSEQKEDMRRDPVGTGRRHAEERARAAAAYPVPRERVVLVGVNEPAVWVDLSVVPYTVAFLDRLAELGYRGGALNLSVGWPANNGEGQPPDWAPFAPVEEAIKRGGHYLVLHEYFDHRGPDYNWGWWCGRFEACPWGVPIIIGEAGLDEYVGDGGVSDDRRGWRGWFAPGEYAGHVRRYVERCAADGRIVGVCLYTTDYSHPWSSFDTLPAADELAQIHVEAGQGPSTGQPSQPAPPAATGQPSQPAPPPSLHHPMPGATLTQHWGQNAADYARFGFWGHNGTDLAAPHGTPVRAMAEGVVAFVGEDSDYGRYVRVHHAQHGVDTFYAHLASVVVQDGQRVLGAEVLGHEGSTGNSTGPHLHLEVRLRDGEGYREGTPMSKGRVDPETWAIVSGLQL